MDLLTIGLWNEHDREFLALFGESRINAECQRLALMYCEVQGWPEVWNPNVGEDPATLRRLANKRASAARPAGSRRDRDLSLIKLKGQTGRSRSNREMRQGCLLTIFET